MCKYFKFLVVCFFASAISAIMFSCKEDPIEEAPVFEVAASDKTQNFTSSADSRTVAVNTNRVYTPTSSQTWCTAIRAEGNSVRISVSENTGEQSRTATVTLASDGLTSITITVNQTGTDPVLAVEESDLIQEFTAAANSRGIAVLANREFSVTNDPDKTWCFAVRMEGNNIRINVETNTEVLPRTSTVTLSVTGLPDVVITVNQEGADPIFEVAASNKTQQFSAETGSKTITVTANVEFEVEPDGDEPWCTAVRGEGNTVVITVADNSGPEPRFATVTLTSAGMPNIEITVNQAGNLNVEYEWTVTTIFDPGIPASSGTDGVQWLTVDPKNPNHL